MADIEIVCARCDNRFRISEYAAPRDLACQKCGAPIQLPETLRPGPPRPALKLATAPPPEPAPSAAATVSDSAERRRWFRPRRPRRRRRQPSSRVRSLGCWAAFVVLTAVLAYVRFRAGLPVDTLTRLKQIALGALLFIHVVITLYAFTEDFFYGALCLVIPGYSAFYLFAMSDAYYLRAVAGAILVVFGYDSYLMVKDTAEEVYVRVSGWIQGTGAVVKERAYQR
jgi:DNA-directed RNA polymerase subunit RPC12/RpoP